MVRESRQTFKVAQPLAGLMRAISQEEISPQHASGASEVRFEQGWVQKREGRTAVAGTDSSPLAGKVSHITSQLGRTLLIHTNGKVYRWIESLDTVTDITGSVTIEGTQISSTLFAGDYYFTTEKAGDDLFKVTGATLSEITTGYQGAYVAGFGERMLLMGRANGVGERTVRWSAIGDATTWNADDFVELVSQMGIDQIRGCATLGNSLIIYGERTIVECSYTGSAITPFAFSVRATGVGLLGRDASLVTGYDAHYFLSGDGLTMLDLSLVPRLVDMPVKDWFKDNVNQDQADNVVLTIAPQTNELIMYYPSSGSDENDSFLALDLDTKTWTEGSRSGSAVTSYKMTGARTYDELPGTYNSLVGSYDDLGSAGMAEKTIVGDENGTLWFEMSGINLGASSLLGTWDTKDFVFEDEGGVVWLSLEFEATGDALGIFYSQDEGDSWTLLGSSVILTSDWVRYRKDFRVVGKMIRFRFMNGDNGGTFKFRWFRIGFQRTGRGGTVPV